MPAKQVKPRTVARMIIGRDLRTMRKHRKITEQAMATKLKIKSRKTIRNWETDISQPNINQFIRFCAYAGFDPAQVIRQIIERDNTNPKRRTAIDLNQCRDVNGRCKQRIKVMKMSVQFSAVTRKS